MQAHFSGFSTRKAVSMMMALVVALSGMPLASSRAQAQGGSMGASAPGMTLPPGVGPGGSLTATTAQAQATYAAPEKPSMKQIYNMPGGGGGVNLFTGEASFSVPLGAIAGRNGLSWSLRASYNSNVLSSVVQWNGDQPTGYLGLGWTLEAPRIVVDTRNTGRMQDDIYYLQLGSGRQRLMLDPNQEQSDSVLNFRTQQWGAWKIRFTPVNAGADGQWDLTDESGLHYKFDGASVGGGVQWGVRWGGWIGPSKYGSANDGAENFPLVYNLTSIEEPWGDKLTFQWTQENQFIGANGNRQYGRENRLVSVTSASMGTKLVLNYGNKANDSTHQEYVIPHKTSGSVSYYQDQVETKFLESVDSYRNITAANPEGDRYAYTKFTYDWVNATGSAAAYAKRVLTVITASDAASEHPIAPPTLYAYYTDPKERDTVGALKSITTPAGGTVTYSYATQFPAQGSVRYIENQPDGYSRQRTWYGDDYTVTMWTKPTGTGNQATVQFHTNEWQGRWIGFHSEDIAVNDWTKVQVETSRDFYAANYDTPSSARPALQLVQRKTNGWNPTTINLSSSKDTNTSAGLAVGDNFAVVSYLSGGTGIDAEVRWDGARWYDRYSSLGPATQRLVRARGDFYLSASWTSAGQLAARLVTVSREGWANFVTPSWTPAISEAANYFDLEIGSSFGFLRGSRVETSGSTHWYGYALQLGLGSSNTTTGTVQKVDVSVGSYTWYWPLQIVDSTIGMGVKVLQMAPPSRTLPVLTTADIFQSATQAASTPYVYMPEAIRNGISQYFQFYLSAWAYDPAADAWAGLDLINATDRTNGPISAGREYFYANNNGGQPVAELRNPGGNWSISASIPGTKAWIAARDRMFVSADTAYDKLRFAAPGGAQTSGSLGDYSPPSGNTYVSDDPYALPRNGKRTIGPNTVVSWPSANGRSFENATALSLERTYNYSSVPGYPGPYATGATAYLQPSVVVSQVVASTGYETAGAGLPGKTTRFAFDPTTATMDPTGIHARYNHVTVSQGAGGAASTADHFGQSEYFFYNGLNPANYDGQGTNLPNWGAAYNPHPGNEATYYNYLDGLPYYTAEYLESYNGSTWIRTLKSTLATSYNTVEKNMASLRPAYYVQPVYSVSYADGAVGGNGQLTGARTETGWGYYQVADGAFENFLKNVQIARINANGVAETTDQTYTYAAQIPQYASGMLTGNYLLPVAQTRVSKIAQDPANPGQTCVYAQNPAVACTILGVSAATYRDWGGGKWGPVSTYSWNRGAASSAFNFASPNADWVKGVEITTINTAGLVTETRYSYGTAQGGTADQQTVLYSSIGYDNLNRFPVSRFADARSNGYRNAGYIGFESYESLTGWSLTTNASVTTGGTMHTGDGVLVSNGSGDMLTPVFTKVTGENRGIQVASLYAQIPEGKTLTLKLEAMTGSTISQTYTRVIAGTAAKASGWQYLELAAAWGSGLDGMRFTATANANAIRLDNLRFGAAATPFSAQVINDQKGLLTATLGHNGEVTRALYDTYDQPIITAGPVEQTTTINWGYYSRFAAGRSFDPASPQPFKPNDPNAAGTIAAIDGGQYDDFRNGTGKWICSGSCATSASRGEYQMALTPNTRASLDGGPQANAAVRARLSLPTGATGSRVRAGIGNWIAEYSQSTGQYDFYGASGEAHYGTVTAPFDEDWILVYLQNSFFFFAGGKLLFTLNNSASASFTPYVQNTGSTTVAVKAFATYANPMIAMQFIDGAGRAVQSNRNVDDRGAKVAGVLYNANWDRTVSAKAIDYAADSTSNGLYFRPNYIGRDSTGKLTGDVTTYYGAGANLNAGYTNDGGYPFWGGANRKEPADRSATRGQPGTAYNTEAGGAKVSAFDYGVNLGSASGTTSTNLAGADRNPMPDNAFQRAKSTSPNNANRQSFATTTGGDVGSAFLGATTYGQAGQNIQTLRTMDAYDRTDAIYHPNYFPQQQDSRDAFKASLTYDSYDRVNSMTTVDAGTGRSIGNRAGQLRYWADANSTATGRVSYAKYDKYGRLLEAGQIPGSITDSALQASAEDISQPVNTDANWRLRYVYDRGAFGQAEAEATNVNFYSKSRLSGIRTRDAGGVGNDYSSQAFVYDERGRVNAVLEEYRPYGVGQITGYSYNNLGMPTKIVYPKPIGSTALLAGTCSEPTPAVIANSTVAQVNSNLERNSWSFSDYVRSAVGWIATWSSGNSQRVLKDELLRRTGAGGEPACASADPSLVVAVTALVLGLRATKFTQNAPLEVRISVDALPDSGLIIDGEAYFLNEVSVSQVAVATAPTITYTYNRLGQITSIGNGTDAAHFATYNYGPNGEILAENRYRDARNGDMHYAFAYRYDSLGRAASTNLKYAGSGSVNYWQENLAYETGPTPNYDGKITQITGCQWNGISGSNSHCTSYTRAFTYLVEGALASATDQAYPYLNYALTRKDASSNLLATSQGYQPSPGTGAMASYAYVYQAGTNRVSSVSGAPEGGINYTYDANGNVKSKSRHIASAEYDPFSNRVTKVTQADQNNQPLTSNYQLRYGGLLGERVSSTYTDTASKQIVESVYFRGLGFKPLTILQQKNQSEAVNYKHMIYGPKGIIAMVAQEAGTSGDYTTTEYWPVQNYQGSVVSVYREPTSGGDAASMDQFQYSATGNIYRLNTSTGRFQAYYDQEPLVPYLFQGQEYDWQAQLHNFNARLYDSQTLGFLQPDPKFSAGKGSYVGLANDPVNMIDPDGRASHHFTKAIMLRQFAFTTLAILAIEVGSPVFSMIVLAAWTISFTQTLFASTRNGGASVYTQMTAFMASNMRVLQNYGLLSVTTGGYNAASPRAFFNDFFEWNAYVMSDIVSGYGSFVNYDLASVEIWYAGGYRHTYEQPHPLYNTNWMTGAELSRGLQSRFFGFYYDFQAGLWLTLFHQTTAYFDGADFDGWYDFSQNFGHVAFGHIVRGVPIVGLGYLTPKLSRKPGSMGIPTATWITGRAWWACTYYDRYTAKNMSLVACGLSHVKDQAPVYMFMYQLGLDLNGANSQMYKYLDGIPTVDGDPYYPEIAPPVAATDEVKEVKIHIRQQVGTDRN